MNVLHYSNQQLLIGLLSFILSRKKYPKKQLPHIFKKKTKERTLSVTLHISHKLSSILKTNCALQFKDDMQSPIFHCCWTGLPPALNPSFGRLPALLQFNAISHCLRKDMPPQSRCQTSACQHPLIIAIIRNEG